MTYGLFQAFCGGLGDRIGKYKVVALCTIATTLGTMIASFAKSIDWLITARFISGMTAAGVIPLSMA